MCSKSCGGGRGGGGRNRCHYFRILCAVLCLLVCVHHSHQAENLTLDQTKGPDAQSSDGGGLRNDDDDDHHGYGHGHGHGPSHAETDSDRRTNIGDYKTWLCATAAVFFIALCGIFGVLVIPIMQKVFYQHLIQFLVALAVGTLAGDAIMHLLPHALLMGLELTHEQEEVFEAQAAWKGFFALMALVVFFLLEKVINIVGAWKESRNRGNASKSKKVHVVRSGHKTSDKAVGERLCKHKYSSYCVADIDIEKMRATPPTPPPTVPEGAEDTLTGEECELMLSAAANAASADAQNCSADSNTSTKMVPAAQQKAKSKTVSVVDPLAPADLNSYDTVFIHDHEHTHHGHSHAHSHLHSKPDSISSVAWMVLFGDGIHNLADGMAIGAAFSQATVTGIATSIAILCHELPHEIGDFAMLLKAGMSVKQAIFYNLLSSFLAFIGMVLGILLGGVENWSSWILAATAGVFLYVALVDMIPELNSGHAHPFSNSEQSESLFVELGLQLLGMSLGIVCMLLIALYEHDMKVAFTPT